MEIGRVVGNLWATKKDENMEGQKLLVVERERDDKGKKEGFVVACDIIGAGIGDMVLLTRGTSARQAVGNLNVPVDLAIVGIVDSVELAKNIDNGGTFYEYK